MSLASVFDKLYKFCFHNFSTTMKKILLLALAGIGDSLLLTPTIHELKKAFPQSKITVLVMYETNREMFERNKDVDEVIYFNFLKKSYLKSLAFVLQQRLRKYDLSFLAYPANRFRHNLITFLIGARKRYGHLYPFYTLQSFSFLHTHRLSLDPYKHAKDENLQLLLHLGYPVSLSQHLSFHITTEEEKLWKQNL